MVGGEIPSNDVIDDILNEKLITVDELITYYKTLGQFKDYTNRICEERTNKLSTINTNFFDDEYIKCKKFDSSSIDYNVRHALSGVMTDSFMEFLSPQIFTNVCTEIYKFMTASIEMYRNKYNAIYGDMHPLNKDSIIFSFKGGNIINMYLKKIFYTILDKHIRTTGELNLQSYILISDTIKKTLDPKKTFGDIDMMIHINDTDMTVDTYTKIKTDMEKIFILMTVHIKTNFSMLFTNKSKFCSSMNSKLVDIEKIVLDNKYGIVQQITTPFCTMNNINNNLMIVETTESDKNDLHKHSKIISKRKNYSELSDIITIGRVLTNHPTKTMISDFKDTLKKDIITVTYIKTLKFRKLISNISFSLTRLKINVSCKLINGGVPKTISCPVELLDCVCIDNDDEHSRRVTSYINKYNLHEYSDFYIGSQKMTLITPYYTFFDLCLMIFCYTLFPWEEKKYSKRINRFFYMLLFCVFYDTSINDARRQVISELSEISAFLEDLINVKIQKFDDLLLIFIEYVYNKNYTLTASNLDNQITLIQHNNIKHSDKLNIVKGSPLEITLTTNNGSDITFYLNNFYNSILKIMIFMNSIKQNRLSNEKYNNYINFINDSSKSFTVWYTNMINTIPVGTISSFIKLNDYKQNVVYNNAIEYFKLVIESCNNIIKIISSIDIGNLDNMLFGL